MLRSRLAVAAQIAVAIAQIAIAIAWLVVGSRLIGQAQHLGYFDTREYRKIAALPLGDPGFWNGVRPWAGPLLMKLAGSDERQVKIQIALYAIGWLAFAFSVAGLARRGVIRVALFALLLSLGLCTDVFYWQKSISSESVSTSLLLLALALAIPLLRRPSPLRVALLVPPLVAATVPWFFTRDANGYVLLSLVVAATVLAAIIPSARRKARVLVPILVATVIALGLQSRAADRSGRWKFCFVNLLGQRVLGYQARRAYFEAHGMPANPKVQCFAGKWGNSCGGDWSGFGPFLDGNIKGLWARYLLSRPAATLAEPLFHLPELLSATFKADQDHSTLMFYFKVKEPEWQRRLNVFVFANSRDVRWPLGGALLVAAALALRRRWAGRLLVPAALVVAIYPMIFFIWHADAMEPQRHAILPVLLSRVGLWSAILLGLDVLLERRIKK